MEEQEMAKKNLIFKAMVGSRLYGTETPNSDKDYVGIFIPDKDYVLGLKHCEQVDVKTNPSDSGRRNNKDDVDTTLYSLPKFIKLAADNNPNIVELFFVDSKHVIFSNEYGERLLQAFPFFISKRVKARFLGYAVSQKHKIMTKNPVGNRKQYIEKFGYDVKFASHLIRLLEEGIQLLVEGKLSFPIPNNRLIKGIKEGKYTLDQVLAKADVLENLIETAYVTSKLQNHFNFKAIHDLQMDMLTEFWEKQERKYLDESFYNATKKLGW